MEGAGHMGEDLGVEDLEVVPQDHKQQLKLMLYHQVRIFFKKLDFFKNSFI